MELRKLMLLIGMTLMSCNPVSTFEINGENYKEKAKVLSEGYTIFGDNQFILKDYDLNGDNRVDIREAYFLGEEEPFIYFFDLNGDGGFDRNKEVFIDGKRDGWNWNELRLNTFLNLYNIQINNKSLSNIRILL